MGFVKDNFEVLDSLAKCIAIQFGTNCEVVLHDLTLPYDRTIVSIYNGHVTGREVGGGGTNAGLEILRGTAMPEDQYGYINYTKDGRTLRTSSKYFMGEDGKVEGSLCINLDITGLTRSSGRWRSSPPPAPPAPAGRPRQWTGDGCTAGSWPPP